MRVMKKIFQVLAICCIFTLRGGFNGQELEEPNAAIFTISLQDSAERGKTRSKGNGLNEEAVAKVMEGDEDRSGKAATGRIPDEIMKAAANASYNSGEQATSYEERKSAFNKALLLYSRLEETIKPPSPFLEQAIGDAYFQLGEYPWAILYYQRSLQQNPIQPLLIAQLEKTKKILGLLPDFQKELSPWNMKPFLSFFHRFDLLRWMLFMTFVCISCAIWLPLSFIRKMAVACTFLALIFLGIHGFEYYSQALEGILIRTSGFYSAPDKNRALLTNQPLLGGTRVQIVQMTNHGDWLKIMRRDGIGDGTMGYVPTQNVRPIRID